METAMSNTLPTPPPAPSPTALTVAWRYAGPALGGVAAGVVSYHGGASAIGHLVDQIGFAEALVVTSVAGAGALIWATGKTIASWVETSAARAMPRLDAFLKDFGEASRASAATALMLREADDRAREERAQQAERLEELAQMGENDHADLADGLRRCEAHAKEAAHAAEAARKEVMHLSERFGVQMEKASAIADRAATNAARAAQVCEALARELQIEKLIPAAAPPALPVQEA
jgi:hypothetical protein